MKKSTSISLSFIIPTYYRYEYLKNIFELISIQTIAPKEIIVVDQTPEPDRPLGLYHNYSKTLTNLKVYYLDKPSAPAARNFGADKATSDILLIIDDDIIFEKDFVESHLEVMQGENVDVVNGGITLQKELPDEYPWDISEMDPVRLFLGAPNFKWEGMMLSVSSCNFSIKKQVYMDAGGFDVNCPRMQDFEFGYRLYRNGAKIFYSHRPWAQHLRGEGGLRENPLKFDRLIGAIYLHKKYFSGWITKQFFLKYLLRFHVIIKPWSILKLIIANYQANKLFNK